MPLYPGVETRPRTPTKLPPPRRKPRSLALAGPNVRLVKIDDHTGFIHFNRDQCAVGEIFRFEPELDERENFLALSSLKLDFFLGLPDVDERAGDQLMCSCLAFEMHIDDVVILVEYRGHLVSRLKRLMAVPLR